MMISHLISDMVHDVDVHAVRLCLVITVIAVVVVVASHPLQGTA